MINASDSDSTFFNFETFYTLQSIQHWDIIKTIDRFKFTIYAIIPILLRYPQGPNSGGPIQGPNSLTYVMDLSESVELDLLPSLI